MFDARELYNRYQQDHEFHALVKAMEGFILSNGYDPMELRQALFFACYKYNQEHGFEKIFAAEDKIFTELK